MTPIQKNIASALASILLLGASAGAFAFFARGIARDLAAREAIAARINDLAAERIAAVAASGRSKARAPDLERIRGFFVRSDRPVEFVEQLETVAKKTGNTAVLDADESSGAGGDLIFRITLEGTRESVVRFVRAIEAVPYLARAEEMNFQNIRAGETRGSAVREASARLLLAVRVRTR